MAHGRVPLGRQDRGDIHDWVDLMHLLGVTPPPRVQAFIDDPRQKVKRQQAKQGVVAAAPQLTPAPVQQSAYAQRFGGATNPMSYRDYANADDFARMGDYANQALVSRYTVPTQVNGIPNVIPQGARITFQGAQQPQPFGRPGGRQPMGQVPSTNRQPTHLNGRRP